MTKEIYLENFKKCAGLLCFPLLPLCLMIHSATGHLKKRQKNT